MQLISVSVDELRRAANAVENVPVTGSELPLFRVSGQPGLTLAVAEFVGCLNDCASERRRDIEALAASLREVAAMYDVTETRAHDDLRALRSTLEASVR